ncbi:MAG: hypothetical protein GY773_28825, partial [Actinomycetia bacterium]|nr:hypothetical protein [Actinomycetes bacterium]
MSLVPLLPPTNKTRPLDDPSANPIPPTTGSLDALSSPFLAEQVQAFLAPLGLEGLVDWAMGILGEGGFSQDKLEIELERQPAFLERFPAIFERREAGLPPVSVSDVLIYERQVADLVSFWGIPVGVIDPQQTLADD